MIEEARGAGELAVAPGEEAGTWEGSLRGTELLPLAPSAAASNNTQGCGLINRVAGPTGCVPADVQVVRVKG